MLFKGFRHRRFGRKPKLICLYCYKIFITCVIHEPTQCTTLMISVCRLQDKSKTTGELIYISSAQFNHLSAYYPFEPSLFAFYCIILDIPMLHHHIVDKSYWLRSLLIQLNGWVYVARWRNVIVIYEDFIEPLVGGAVTLGVSQHYQR